MALFGRDRDGKDRTPDVIGVSGGPTEGAAPREVAMAERTTTQQTGPGGIGAFLGKGTKVTGKLVFDGPGRIEGHVEGEITAQDVLTIGDGATVNAKVTGTS